MTNPQNQLNCKAIFFCRGGLKKKRVQNAGYATSIFWSFYQPTSQYLSSLPRALTLAVVL